MEKAKRSKKSEIGKLNKSIELQIRSVNSIAAMLSEQVKKFEKKKIPEEINALVLYNSTLNNLCSSIDDSLGLVKKAISIKEVLDSLTEEVIAEVIPKMADYEINLEVLAKQKVELNVLRKKDILAQGIKIKYDELMDKHKKGLYIYKSAKPKKD